MRYRAASAYSVLAYVNQAASVLLNLAFIRLLPLNVLGEVAIAKVWMQLTDYSHLGFRFALDRYVPVWDKTRSENLLWLCLLVSSGVSAILLCVALVFTASPLLICAFVASGYCIAIATILKNYHRAGADNGRMLFVYALCPTLPTLVQTGVMLAWGFHWFLVVTIPMYSVATLLLFRRVDVRTALKGLDITATVRSVRASAGTLLANAIIIFLSFSVDRVILNHFSTKEVVGEYSVVLFGFSLLLIIPSTLAEFIFPRIVTETAQTGKMFFPKEMLTLLAPTVLAVLAALPLIPLAIDHFTSYSRLTPLIQFVTLGIVPYAATPILFHVMSALDMRRELVIAACLVLAVYVAVLVWGGLYADHLLEFFTAARAGYGYLLLAVYALFIMSRKAVRP